MSPRRASISLDFFFVAPSEQQANALANFLREETDYEVGISSTGGGFLKKKTWVVNGTTQETEVSLDILDQWVTWMVSAGEEKANCEFDGWGAAIP